MKSCSRVVEDAERLGFHIGARLAQERFCAGITLRAAAKKVGLSPSGLSLIERGHCRPSAETAERIVRSYGLNYREWLRKYGAGKWLYYECEDPYGIDELMRLVMDVEDMRPILAAVKRAMRRAAQRREAKK